MAWYNKIKATDTNPKVNTTVFKSSSEIITVISYRGVAWVRVIMSTPLGAGPKVGTGGNCE